MITKMKKAVITVLGSAAMKYMKKLNDEQEMLIGMADMIMHTYAAESVVLRTEKLVKNGGEEKNTDRIAMAKLYVFHAVNEVQKNGLEVLLAFTEGKE
jgi:hypothetical protein